MNVHWKKKKKKKWRHCNALQGESIIDVLMVGWKWYFGPLDL